MADSTLDLKIIPNAPRDEIACWLGDALKIKIHAPALEGRANDALLDFLAEALHIPRRDLSLLQGAKSRQKVIRIAHLDRATVRARIAATVT